AAVLPDRLHGAVGPAVALGPQLLHRLGCLGPGAGVLRVDDLPAVAVDGHGDVGVLGEGVVAHAADPLQRGAAEGADGAGDGGHALHDVVHPAVEVEAHHVLDVLPGADQLVLVADLNVARDGAHAGVAEGLHQFADGGRLEDRVAVHHHDDVVAGVGHT